MFTIVIARGKEMKTVTGISQEQLGSEICSLMDAGWFVRDIAR